MGEQGHFLLKRLGKTKLRPGGIVGTNWLLDRIDANEDTKILEVACNEAANLVYFTKKYNNENYGIDMNEDWLNKGRKKIEGLESNINLEVGDARKLPYEDNTFDYILNEAMLTMLSEKDKSLAIKEYYRVLKPGGSLLTHDIRQLIEDSMEVRNLQKTLNVPSSPLTLEKWLKLYTDAGFQDVDYKSGEMSFLTERGIKLDEGQEGFEKIMENAMKDANKEQFIRMLEFFNDENVMNNLYYLVIEAIK